MSGSHGRAASPSSRAAAAASVRPPAGSSRRKARRSRCVDTDGAPRRVGGRGHPWARCPGARSRLSPPTSPARRRSARRRRAARRASARSHCPGERGGRARLHARSPRRTRRTGSASSASTCSPPRTAARPRSRASARRRGTIVNVSSVYGLMGRAGMGQYDTTKAAVLGFTRALAVEEAPHGIRVNAVCPGGTITPYHVRRAAARGRVRGGAARASRAADNGLLGRWAEPREVAYPILFLASDGVVVRDRRHPDGGRRSVDCLGSHSRQHALRDHRERAQPRPRHRGDRVADRRRDRRQADLADRRRAGCRC